MKAEKMRGIDFADLQRQAQDSREQLFRFRFQMGMGQLEGLKKYRNLKKDRARMMTVLGEKEANGEVAAESAAKRTSKKEKKNRAASVSERKK